MAKNTKGFQLNLGPAKKEIMDFAQGFGVLTSQLNQFMTTMGQAQRGTQQFGQAAAMGGMGGSVNVGSAFQTPIGLQTQAAAINAGVQSTSYQDRFDSLMHAVQSNKATEHMSRRDAEIVAAAREASMRAGQVATHIDRSRNGVAFRQVNGLGAAGAAAPIVRSLLTDMQQAGYSPAQAAFEVSKIGSEAHGGLQTLGGNGYVGQARQFANMGEAGLSDQIRTENAKRAQRAAYRATSSQEDIQAERESKLADIRLDNIKRGFNTSFQVGDQARQGMTRAAVTGDQNYRYGLGDIVAAKSNLAGGNTDLKVIKEFTDKLKQSSDALDRGLGTEIDKIAGQFGTLASKFERLNTSLQGQEVGSQKYQKTLAELAQTSGQLNQVQSDLKEAYKQGGGGGGDGGGGFGSKMRGFLGGATAVGGLALAGAQELFEVRRTMNEASLGSERKVYGQEAELANMAFQSRREMANPADPRNAFKWRAEMFLSKSQLADNQFLGVEGRQRALDRASTETARSLELQKQNSKDSSVLGIGKMALGALAIGGVATLAAGPMLAAGGVTAGLAAGASAIGVGGLGAITAGMAGVFSGAKELFTGNKENEFNKAEHGGLAGTFLGRSLGGSSNDALQNKRAATLGLSVETLKRAEELRQDALTMAQEQMEGIAGLDEARQTQIQGAALIGAASVRGIEGIEGEFGRSRMAGQMAFNNYTAPAGVFPDISKRANHLAMPLHGGMRVTSDFGDRIHPTHGGHRHHGGVDLVSNTGDMNLYSVNDATVLDKGYNREAGNYVSIQDASGMVYRYNHMTSPASLNKGDSVSKDAILGTMGATGATTGKHLHFSAYPSERAYNNRQPMNPGFLLRMQEKRGISVDATAQDRARQTSQDQYFDQGFADRTTDYASLRGLTYGQFGQKQNELSNFIGQSSTGDRVASVGMTGEAIDLSRSGFGSFQSILGNLGNLNQVRGGQNNFDSLKEIFASGVTAGFDKSRTAQMFVQSVTGLAQAIGTTNTGDLSKSLSIGAQLGSANDFGIGDERSAADAAQGIAGLAQKTGRATGFIGSSKLSALVRSGATMAGGLGLMQGMDLSTLSGGLDELSRARSASDITDPKIRSLVLARGDTPQAIQEVTRMLQAAKSSELNSTTAITSIYGDKSMQELRNINKDEFMKLSPSKRLAKLRQLTASAQESGAGTSLGFNETGALAAEIIKDRGLLNGRDMQMFQATFQAGTKVSRDAAAASKANADNLKTVKMGARDRLPADSGNLESFFSAPNATVDGLTASDYQAYKTGKASQEVRNKISKLTPEDLRNSSAGIKNANTDSVSEKMSGVLDAATAKSIADAAGVGIGKTLNPVLIELNNVLNQIKLRINK